MYKQITLFVVVLYAFFGLSIATLGVDISGQTDVSSFSCLKSNGYSFAIISCWQLQGQPDPNCPKSISNAWAGGMSNVDVYITPCISCGDGSNQVQTMIKFIQSYNATFNGMVWFDVGSYAFWSRNQVANEAFFKDMVKGAQVAGVKVGISTSTTQWDEIMGGWNGASSFPLWYSDLDDSPSFTDFSPFSGWTTPTIKQYYSDVTICGLGDVNQNYY
ncbi:hypothetical protein DFA_02763 [Cavenderia fasciculata]|uniref:Glycoside hydrolase family 25 protein n=1 Tax=Cavenderia fasciculata TaxID=261658 RepID=F4PI86_CACFS|nr:uncharacterized protein DFA_02763 [Cavenderia fasciculata]EGG24520.1 hypothetical protein DFA_02763 [Cavenderia fasciculata]|eukprot:XP_004362371.1 hypothetical protein DFA_02763 [Cavenderia fasciculata]